jgi:hypothetical protein
VLFDGRNGGTVELLDNVLVIRRQGLGSFLTQGVKGEKRIPYSSIASVQFKEAGFTTGYIQFGIVGGIESRGGVWEATTDENTVLFTKEAAEDFRRLRDIVEERAEAARNPRPASAHNPAPGGIAEELGRLADLRDRGVLTPGEFDEQKARLLAGPATDAPAARPRQASPVRELRRTAVASPEPPRPEPSSGFGRKAGIGCLVLLGIYLLFSAIGAQVGTSATGQAPGASAAP